MKRDDFDVRFTRWWIRYLRRRYGVLALSKRAIEPYASMEKAAIDAANWAVRYGVVEPEL